MVVDSCGGCGPSPIGYDRLGASGASGDLDWNAINRCGCKVQMAAFGARLLITWRAQGAAWRSDVERASKRISSRLRLLGNVPFTGCERRPRDWRGREGGQQATGLGRSRLAALVGRRWQRRPPRFVRSLSCTGDLIECCLVECCLAAWRRLASALCRGRCLNGCICQHFRDRSNGSYGRHGVTGRG
jgi:hypothetical protein